MHTFTLPNPDQIRGDQLVDEIFQETGLDVEGSYGFEPPDTVHIALDLTPGQVAAIEQVITSHVPNPLYFQKDRDVKVKQDRLDSDRAAWLGTLLANKTPAEVEQLVQNRLASATTVAEMKTVLIDLLPIMALGIAALAHRVLED